MRAGRESLQAKLAATANMMGAVARIFLATAVPSGKMPLQQGFSVLQAK
ncbi:hypothetical protein [Paenibacillus nasutitermitis]|nr:hypothetical protein [Paenibacillus nasutitermitis]